MNRLLPLAALAVILAACSSSRSPAVESAPASQSGAVDGLASDWAGALRPVEKQPGLSMGVRDDGETLTVALVATTPEQALRLSRGVTFWFDGDGGTERGFGVGFPIRPERGTRGDRQPGERGSGEPGERLDRSRERFDASTRRMAVYRGGGGELQLAVGEIEGIEAAAQWSDAGLVIEVSVPVESRANGYTIGAAPGATVGLGIETVDLPEGAGRRAGPGGGPPGGGRGGIRSSGGRGGARGAGGAPRQLQTETTWVRVTLSR